jgi:hypothetical protein
VKEIQQLLWIIGCCFTFHFSFLLALGNRPQITQITQIRKQKSGSSRQKAEAVSSRQKAESRRQKAEGHEVSTGSGSDRVVSRQGAKTQRNAKKAVGSRQKAEGRKQKQ